MLSSGINEEKENTKRLYANDEIINTENYLQQEPQTKELKLYPNPNNGIFKIVANFPLTDIANFKVINLLGISVYETSNLVSNTVQLQTFAIGQFFVIAILKDGTLLTQKMIIQR